jgi:hypothetical protein
LRDDLLRKSLTAIRVGWHLIRITPDHCDSANAVDNSKPKSDRLVNEFVSPSFSVVTALSSSLP